MFVEAIKKRRLTFKDNRKHQLEDVHSREARKVTGVQYQEPGQGAGLLRKKKEQDADHTVGLGEEASVWVRRSQLLEPESGTMRQDIVKEEGLQEEKVQELKKASKQQQIVEQELLDTSLQQQQLHEKTPRRPN